MRWVRVEGSAPVSSRRQEHTEGTRRALLAAARELFGTRGYGATSLDDVASAARVTKGALYHHHEGKRQLFEAVIEELEAEVVARIAAAAAGGATAWDRALRGLDASLDACLDPVYRRIVLQDAPVVVGPDRWRELEGRYSLGLMRATLDALMADGTLRPQPPELLARVLLAAELQAAQAIAESPDPPVARRQAGELLRELLSGLRARDRA